MGQLLLLQHGQVKILEEKNKAYSKNAEPSEQKVNVKKSKVPKRSAEEYMAYLNMRGSSRFGV